jgi:hypothetical protein
VWYLWRQPEWIEVQDTTKDEGEIWERGANGQIAFQRVFHRDQRVINYTPGDLRALQSSPDWQRLSSILHPTFLKQTLQATGETTVLERQAQRYQGQVNGVTFEVLWFDTEQIPALIRQIYPDCEEIVHLTAIPPLPSASWPRRATSDYRHLDYADLGDMASDPFVRRLLRGMQHSHAH